MLNKRFLLMFSVVLLAAALAASGCAGPGAQVRKEGAPAAAGTVVKDIRTAEKDGNLILSVEGNQPLAYSMFKLSDPLRLALDLPGADLGTFTKNVPVNLGPVSFIKPVPPAPAKDKAAPAPPRLEIYLARPAGYAVKADGLVLNVTISAEAAPKAAETVASAPIAPAPAPAKKEEKPASAVSAGGSNGPSPSEKMAEVVSAKKEEPAAPQGKAGGRVSILDIMASPEGTQVLIEGDGALEYEYFVVESKSLVLDIFDVLNGISPLNRKVTDEYVKQIRIGEHFEPRRKVRVVMDLVKPGDFKIVSMGEKILINFGALAKEPDEKLRASLSNVVTDVYFRPLEGKSVIEIVTSRPAEYQKIDSEDPTRLILEVGNSRVTPEAQKTLDLTTLNRAVSKIVSFQYKKDGQPVVRVVSQFREQLSYKVEAAGNRILVEVPEAGKPAVAAVVAQAAVATPVTVVIPATAPAAAANPAPANAAAPSSEPPAKKYTGRKLSLDFKDADIQDVLRLIADVSGINFVSGTEVKGRVTIKIADVPWDQALDVILKTNTPPLTQIREADNIIRITTTENVRREEDEKQRTEKAKVDVAKTQQDLEPLVTKSFHISYAKVKDIQPRLESFMSTRKKTDALLQSDDRTNTLIVRDLKTSVDEIEKVIRQLDTPTPAVQIEARIITVNSNYSQNLGIQWGFNYLADAAHGNPTAFQFPNSIALGGAIGGGSGPNLMVNLPASGATSGVGLTLGHIANTLTLDLKISAMEEMGQVEILSNPKVLVVQNEKAIINVGQQLPIPKTDAEGNRTVEFKDVGIKLEVTPQVTADSRIFLDVQVERSSKGADVKTTEGEQFSIDTQRAQTKVLLNDGETSVIGGLFQQNKSTSNSGVPGLSKLPFIGFLFRSKGTTDQRQELLIFLTPKVIVPL